ncbi:MAG: Integral membrane sensor signal transduction histidine kinase [Parcubacteria group bacterium Gr01-1014_30]|nr:MAG: Integral membrane sensor signal transduction histidine kinase [Parcubacteria group bacterium Gr01-1014_30]
MNLPLQIFALENLDLLILGIANTAITLLGVVVFLRNTRSITYKTFLLFALVASVYATVNYMSYQSSSSILVLWALRFVLFSATWYSFLLLQLFYVFPKERITFPKLYRFFLLPTVTLTSLLTLTPFVFSRISELAPVGQVTNPERGMGIVLFAIISIFLVAYGLFTLFKKTFRAKGEERDQLLFVLIGSLITYVFIIVFNLILPVFFNNTVLIPLAPVFTLPFISFTAYAILRYKLLNIKVIATEVLTFMLAAVTLFEVLFARELGVLIFRIAIFVAVLGFGILLIRSVRKEVEQREKLERLSEQLKTANVRLDAALKKVEKLSKAKSEFISIASHQLRTPLTAIKGYISMILEGTYGRLSKKARRPMGNVYESNERLIRLINDLLEVSRIEAGKIELELEEARVEEIIEGVVAELGITAQQKKLYLKWEKPETPAPKLLLDKQKIRQVILNLVNNAVKYTKEGGITIKLKIENLKLKIAIADTGEGMTKEDLGKVFQSFSRGTTGVRLSAEGAGLGLYIAKKFVEMHRGRIWAESEGKGKGSTFYVELPIK